MPLVWLKGRVKKAEVGSIATTLPLTGTTLSIKSETRFEIYPFVAWNTLLHIILPLVVLICHLPFAAAVEIDNTDVLVKS